MVSVAVLLGALGIFTLPRVVLTFAFHDMFVPLDAGWRVASGQTPHFDFHTPVGLVWSAAHGAVAALVGPDPRLVPWSAAAFGLFAWAAMLPIALRRFRPAAAAIVCLFTFLLAAAPRFLDQPSDWLAWMASYNRWSWALLGVVAIATLAPPQRPGRRLDLLDGIVTGLCLGAMIWLKVSFAAASIFAVAVSAAVLPETRRISVVALAIAGAAALALAHSLGQAYLSDILAAAGTQSNLSRLAERWYTILLYSCVPLMAIGALLAIDCAGRTLRTAAATLAWTLACLAASVQNFESAAAALPLVAMALATRVRTLAPHAKPLLLAAAIAPPLLFDAASVGWAALLARGGGAAEQAEITEDGRFVFHNSRGPPRDLFFAGVADGQPLPPQQARNIWDLDYARVVREGVAVLQAHAAPDEAVASLTFSNPYPALLRRPSPRGVNLWQDTIRTWTPDASAAPARLIGDADVVMEPTFAYDWGNAMAAIAATRPELERNWTVIARTPLWTVWRRR